ncbi:MAG: sodium-dependent transporter [Eubacterium sp.]|nr:sodium-dependent transporter [Eubacterium sp.]
MNETKKDRGSFSSGIGFVLAAAGSAVGLGNLWRFPYLAAQYGGGIFIVIYIIIALTFGFTIMTTEIAIGRKTGVSPLIAYGKIHSKFKFLGVLACIVPIIILPYYCVIGGWVMKYMFTFVGGNGVAAAGSDFFGNFIGSTGSPLGFFAFFLAITAIIVLLGVNKGIERVSKVLMPALLVLAVVICIFIMTMDGSGEGIKYYLVPDMAKFTWKAIPAALGQIFYSMSLAMGIMITYGSYTKKETNLVKSVNQIEIFDTVVALLAGFMVVPVVYMVGGAEATANSGPGLMFVALPQVFNAMPAGGVLGALFFILVFFAALTSSISLMEAILSCFMDKFKIGRIPACLAVLVLSIILGVPSSMGNGAWAHITLAGMDFLTFFDWISNSVLMPIVALITCIMIGYFVKPKVILEEATRNGEKLGRKGLYIVMVKVVAPICLVIILLAYTLAQFGLFSM